jgi:hypothetical protein
MISANFFDTLGVAPVRGRTFRADDDRLGAAPVVMLGGGFCLRRFGCAPDIVGKSIDLSGTSYLPSSWDGFIDCPALEGHSRFATVDLCYPRLSGHPHVQRQGP